MRNALLTVMGVCPLLLVLPPAAPEHYDIDPAHTRLAFSVRHMGINNVRGHFDEFAGSLVMEEGTIKEASGTIQVKSINTAVPKRDDHLRSADFFDAAKHPVISFKSKRVERGGGKVVIVADFTIRGVTKEIRLPVTVSGPIEDTDGKTRIGLAGTVKINRKDYGINFDAALETGALLVGEEVTIEIDAEAIKRA